MEPEGTELARDELEPPDQGGKGGDRSSSRSSSTTPPATGRSARTSPIGLNVGDLGFTEDRAVIEIDATNFVGNVLNHGIDIPIEKFTSWMHPPHPTPPHQPVIL